MENKGNRFTAQKVMDAVLEYAKFPVMIQSYAKSQSYDKATGTPYDPNNTRRARKHASSAATSSTLEEVAGLKTNDDRSFILDGNFYPLKAFVLEKINLRKLSRVFWDAHREKNMRLSLKPDEDNKNWREKKNYHRTLKADETKPDTKSEEAGDPKTVFSDLTFMVAATLAQFQLHSDSVTSGHHRVSHY